MHLSETLLWRIFTHQGHISNLIRERAHKRRENNEKCRQKNIYYNGDDGAKLIVNFLKSFPSLCSDLKCSTGKLLCNFLKIYEYDNISQMWYYNFEVSLEFPTFFNPRLTMLYINITFVNKCRRSSFDKGTHFKCLIHDMLKCSFFIQ